MNERTSPVTGIEPTPGESELSVLIGWDGAVDVDVDAPRLVAAALQHPLYRAAEAALARQDARNVAYEATAGHAYEHGRWHRLAVVKAERLEQDLVRDVLRDLPHAFLRQQARRAHVARAVAGLIHELYADPYAARELLRLPADYLDGVEL